MRKLLNSELKRKTIEEFQTCAKIPLIVVLDNVRSQHNIGAIFRTSDAFLVEAIYLCGITATPPNNDIHKSALGAENSVQWKYYKETSEAFSLLKSQGFKIVSVEQAENSTKLHNLKINQSEKYAIVFGNEVKGIDQELVSGSDICLEIEQFGTKHSLNVSISAGIVIWEFFKQLV